MSVFVVAPNIQVVSRSRISQVSVFNPNFTLLEPVGSVLPKFPTGDKSRSFSSYENNTITLLCPAQAFPVPISRFEFNYRPVVILVVKV